MNMNVTAGSAASAVTQRAGASASDHPPVLRIDISEFLDDSTTPLLPKAISGRVEDARSTTPHSPVSSVTTDSPRSVSGSPKAVHIPHGTPDLIPYHHEFLAGMFNFGRGLVELVFQIGEMVHIQHLGAEEGLPPSAEIGVSALFFISGAFTVLSGINLIYSAYNSGYHVEIAQGISFLLQGLIDLSYGACRLSLSMIESIHHLAEMVPEDVLAQLKMAGDALMCISLAITAFRNFYHCHQIASVSQLLTGSPEELVGKLKELREKLLDPKERLHLETILGPHFVEKLDDICFSGKLDAEGFKVALSPKDFAMISRMKSHLDNQFYSKMLVGSLAVVSSIAILVGDIFSAGIVSQVVSILSPTLSAITLIFDGMEMIEGVNETKKIDKIDLILSAIGISIALGLGITMLVMGNIATCGGLSLGLQIAAVVVPIIIPLATMAIKAAAAGQLPQINLTPMRDTLRTVANYVSQSAVWTANQVQQGGTVAYRQTTEASRYLQRQLYEMATRADPRHFVANAIPEDVFN